MKGGESCDIVKAELRKPERPDSRAKIVRHTGVEHGIHEHSVLDEGRKGQSNKRTESEKPEGRLWVIQEPFPHIY